jgi:hypothetical protein
MAWSDGEAEVEVMGIDDEVIGMGAELFGMAEVPLLQAARGRSRAAVRPAMMVDLRMMNLLLRGVSVIRCSEPSASWMGRWEKKSEVSTFFWFRGRFFWFRGRSPPGVPWVQS